MTLTLASTQFSPRILISFMRDQVTQWTLGIFLGTFSYCIAALPAARSLPSPFVPVVTVVGAMALAPVCVGWLIYFIHHISVAISVNTIIDRIRRETEEVIDELMPFPRRAVNMAERDVAIPANLDCAVVSQASGYIRYVDIARLRSLAKSYGICVRLERRVGHFIAEGVPLLKTTHGERITNERALELLAAIDIGPTRTLQQDVEFGIVQIVDIALRAMSPAVNDPTTAISCVDQLSCILIRWLGREAPRSYLLRSAARAARRGSLDQARGAARSRLRANPPLCGRRRGGKPEAHARSWRYRKHRHRSAIRLLLIERGKRLLDGLRGQASKDDLERLKQRLLLISPYVTRDH